MKTIKERYEEELVKFKEQVQDMIKHTFDTDKQIEPVLFALIIKENELSIALLAGIGKFFVNDDLKLKAAEVMRNFNKEFKPIATAFVCEGRATVLEENKATPYVNSEGELKDPMTEAMKDEDNKKDVLMFMFETHDKESSIGYEVKRNPADPIDITLEKMIDIEWELKKEELVGGVMSNLLKENYDEFAEMNNQLNQKHNLN